MYIIIAVVIGVLLFVAGVMDLKSKTISRGLILALAVAGLVGALINVFMNKGFGIWEAVGGVLIGLCAIGLSMISREQIGRGDGLVILILRTGNRNTRLPFIPALFAGYVMCMTAAG